jgi:hypothetical protein
MLFFAALIVFLILQVNQVSWGWWSLPLVVMVLSFWLGKHVVIQVPHVHLGEFCSALRHGEILLMVDVPGARIERPHMLNRFSGRADGDIRT